MNQKKVKKIRKAIRSEIKNDLMKQASVDGTVMITESELKNKFNKNAFRKRKAEAIYHAPKRKSAKNSRGVNGALVLRAGKFEY